MRHTWVITVMVLAVGLAVQFVGGVAARQDDAVAAVKQKFAGNYELVNFRSFGPNGEISDNPYVARIMLSMATENCTLLATENCTRRGESCRAERTFSR